MRLCIFDIGKLPPVSRGETHRAGRVQLFQRRDHLPVGCDRLVVLMLLEIDHGLPTGVGDAIFRRKPRHHAPSMTLLGQYDAIIVGPLREVAGIERAQGRVGAGAVKSRCRVERPLP